MHLACKSESTEIVSLLLDHNCDVSARQFDGRNALDVAVDENNPACVKILLKNSTWEQSMQNVTYTESGRRLCVLLGFKHIADKALIHSNVILLVLQYTFY